MEKYSCPQTVHFESCRAVFQGGGCRVAAHAGAYDAALRCGATFTAVAGTSGGAIIAALVGAGATPDDLISRVSSTNFRSFLGVAKPQDGFSGVLPGLVLRALGIFPSAIARIASRTLLYGGAYSAEPIERWLNEQLRILLPDASGPVRFRDLLIPTSIVATDLANNTAKVWTQELTPDESVAFAVRCSCSIPFYFQSAVQGDRRLVDGGLLSNLPSFVFTDRRFSKQARSEDPILAFKLESKELPLSVWTPDSFAMRLVDAVVDGATDIQLGSYKQVHTVTIPTGDIRAVDFDRMSPGIVDQLVAAGRERTLKFFDDEHARWSSTDESTSFCGDKYDTYRAVVAESIARAEQVLVVSQNSEWFWKLFPTALHWLVERTEVAAILVAPTGTPGEQHKERERRGVMASLGISVTEVPDPGLAAFIFRRRGGSRSSAIVEHQRPTEYTPHSIRYVGPAHETVLDALERRVLQLLDSAPARVVVNAPVLEPDSADELIRRLKTGVVQYSGSEVNLRVEKVQIERIDLVVSKLRAYKYGQIRWLLGMYENSAHPVFLPARLRHTSGNSTLVTPPVLEVHGDRYVAIEGNTRLFSCYRRGIQEVFAIVARGVNSALPGKPVPMRRVLISSGYASPDERFIDFDYSRFRRIEGAIHQP